LPSSAITRTRASFAAIARSRARLRSRLPSSTKTISAPPATSASAASQLAMQRLDRLLLVEDGDHDRDARHPRR
jgi:hypothetical protein